MYCEPLETIELGNYTIAELIEESIDELKERMHSSPEDFADSCEEDVFSEIADGAVPAYNGELLELAMNTMSLATDTPCMGAANDGENNAINLIAANVYEDIRDALSNYYWENQEELKSRCPVCDEPMSDDPEEVSSCENCDEVYHIEHITLNGFCPLCKKKHGKIEIK